MAVNNLSVGVGVFSLGTSGEFKGNYRASLGMLNDIAALDFALPADSLLRGRGVDPRDAFDVDLSPKAEFTLPVGTRPLPAAQTWTPGALQR